jgi:hypothetical protein
MRVLLSLVGVALVAAAFACSSTKRPFAELAPSNDGESADGSSVGRDGSSDASNGEPGVTCYDETQAKPSEDCKCTIFIGGGISAILPCGYGACSSATGMEGICTNVGTVIYVPGCPPLDPDASAGNGGGFRLPPCDAGTPSRLDGGTDADADAF